MVVLCSMLLALMFIISPVHEDHVPRRHYNITLITVVIAQLFFLLLLARLPY